MYIESAVNLDTGELKLFMNRRQIVQEVVHRVLFCRIWKHYEDVLKPMVITEHASPTDITKKMVQ